MVTWTWSEVWCKKYCTSERVNNQYNPNHQRIGLWFLANTCDFCQFLCGNNEIGLWDSWGLILVSHHLEKPTSYLSLSFKLNVIHFFDSDSQIEEESFHLAFSKETNPFLLNLVANSLSLILHKLHDSPTINIFCSISKCKYFSCKMWKNLYLPWWKMHFHFGSDTFFLRFRYIGQVTGG